MYVCTYMCPPEVRRYHWIPLNQSYRQLPTSVGVLGTELLTAEPHLQLLSELLYSQNVHAEVMQLCLGFYILPSVYIAIVHPYRVGTMMGLKLKKVIALSSPPNITLSWPLF